MQRRRLRIQLVNTIAETNTVGISAATPWIQEGSSNYNGLVLINAAGFFNPAFSECRTTRELGQALLKIEGLGRGMMSPDICVKVCRWEIRNEGSGAASVW
jgi:hypothetical protein